MALHLTIENETSLPDGGPLTVSVAGRRGIDIGRDQYLDWTLPDPTRTISGKHCEIRWGDGGYWITDVSRNGTFLNRSPQRLGEPHRLRDGDRLEIGRYIVAVRLDGQEQESAAPPVAAAAASPSAYWDAAGDAPPPLSPRDLRPARENRPAQADFREWAVDIPTPVPSPLPRTPASSPWLADPAGGTMDWAAGPAPAPAPAAPPLPQPRRPGPEDNPWSAPPPGAAGPAAAAPLPAAGPPPAMQGSPEAAAPSRPPPVPSDADWGPPPVKASVVKMPPGDNPWGETSLPPAAPARPPLSAHDAPPLPAPAPPSARVEAPHPASVPDGADLVARIARGAGIPAETFAGRAAGDVAEELGRLVRLSAENLKQLLAARAETKRLARTGSQTMIQALDNNPLKFSPTVEDALRIMLGRSTGGYLDGRRSLEEGFQDLKAHQVKTFSAMQHALRLLAEELDPEAVERSAEADRGLGGLLGSKKARLWDIYSARWEALTAPHEEGIVDAFMIFFAECYDRGDKGR